MVVDNDPDILELIQLYLKRENYDTICLRNGKEVIECVKKTHPHLIILDILLSDTDGVELCQELRKFTDVPILFISAKADAMDKVIALSAGGDDYITKPFHPVELVARVKAHLRRNHASNLYAPEEIFTLKFGKLEIHLHSQTVYLDGQEIHLSSGEFKLLAILAKHPGKIFSSSALYELVWKNKGINSSQTIMVHISNIRKKIEPNPASPVYILTVRGAGYKFNDKYGRAFNA